VPPLETISDRMDLAVITQMKATIGMTALVVCIRQVVDISVLMVLAAGTLIKVTFVPTASAVIMLQKATIGMTALVVCIHQVVNISALMVLAAGTSKIAVDPEVNKD